MLTFADGFSGFGGVKIGAIATGLKPIWSNEKDPEIARVNSDNFQNDRMIVDDFLTLDPSTLPAPDVMHWSPPCINASVAKQADEDGVRESELDRDFSRQIIRFTETHQSKIITLENVFGYRNFQAFQGGEDCEGLVPALWRLGYHVRWWHLNFANFGVPQTRKRLIMIAARDFIPQRPQATHQDQKEMNESQMDMFTVLKPWIGWYASIEDLIPTLPASQFAPWQLARLARLSMEITTTLLGNQQRHEIVGNSTKNEPALTITTNGMKYRAFILPGDNASNDTIRYEDEPTITVGNVGRVGNIPRAFVVDGINAGNFGNEPTARDGENRIFTITGNVAKGVPRAWLSQGRVVKMTPRALARFQSFPDWYQLPEKNALACKGIGNACPPLGMEKIYRGLLP